MPGRRGEVVKIERKPEGLAVTVDFAGDGSDLSTAEYYAPPGIDAPPMIGDEVVVEEAEGEGEVTAVAYQDPNNPSTAADGEFRAYARDPLTKAVAVEVICKGNGNFEVKPLAPVYKLILGKVEIDELGNITTPGEITAMKDAAPVKLSTHLHGTGVGPTTKPTPGT